MFGLLDGSIAPFREVLDMPLDTTANCTCISSCRIDREADDVSKWNEEHDDIAELGGMGMTPHHYNSGECFTRTIARTLPHQLLTQQMYSPVTPSSQNPDQLLVSTQV